MNENTGTPYLVNASGILIKPMNKQHMLRLLSEGARHIVDPETGAVKQIGGFRVATPEEIEAKLSKERQKSKEMQQRELQSKKQNAQIVMMAPDEATLDRMLDAREGSRPPARGKSKE